MAMRETEEKIAKLRAETPKIPMELRAQKALDAVYNLSKDYFLHID